MFAEVINPIIHRSIIDEKAELEVRKEHLLASSSDVSAIDERLTLLDKSAAFTARTLVNS